MMLSLLATVLTLSALETPSMEVSAECEQLSAPGRLKCTVSAIVPAAVSIQWMDVQVLAVPAFLTALRARLSAGEGERAEHSLKWALAFVAKEGGQGLVRFRVRGLLCTADAACETVTKTVDARASVLASPAAP
jgi:hypothetical protein